MAFTLAGLKRALKPGTVIYLRECLIGYVPADEATREVRENRPTFVAFNAFKRGQGHKVSYLYWPSAAEVKETADGFAIYEGSVLAARYTWQAPRADEPLPVKPGYWAVGTNAPELRAAVSEMSKRQKTDLDRVHAEALLGERFRWKVNAENLAEFIRACREV